MGTSLFVTFYWSKQVTWPSLAAIGISLLHLTGRDIRELFLSNSCSREGQQVLLIKNSIYQNTIYIYIYIYISLGTNVLKTCGVGGNTLMATLGSRESYPKPMLSYKQSISKKQYKSLKAPCIADMICECLISKEVLKQIQSLMKKIKVVW